MPEIESTTEVESSESLAESQGLETVSDMDLQGVSEESEESTEESTTETEETTEETETTADESESEDATTEESKEDKSGEASTSKDSDEDDVSTTKMVPLGALHESRNTIKFLKEQIQELMDRKPEAAKLEPEQIEPEDTFKTLTEAEFITLAEDNPVEAMKYNMQLMQHQAAQSEKRAARDNEEASSEYVEQIVDESLNAMEKIVPGIFEDGSEAQTAILDHAKEIGFTSDMFYLTNPQTQVILPGETEPLLLGDQAVSILSVLANSKSGLAKAAENVKTADEIQASEKALEAKLRTEITAELVAKFKSEGNKAFKSIDQIQKTDEVVEFGEKILTDAQFEKLSDKEQEAYLAGA